MNDATDIAISAHVPLFLLVKLVEHPLRRQVIRRVIDHHPGRFASSDMARDLGVSTSNLLYHMNILKRGGAVKLVDTQPARGATRHIYERDYLLDEHEALIVRLMMEADTDKRAISRKSIQKSNPAGAKN